MTTPPTLDSDPRSRPRRWLHRLRLLQLRAATTSPGRLHAATGAVTLAAFGTDGLEDFLKGDALQVGILLAALVILFGARRKDMASSATVGGIALFGLAVAGLASDSFAIGTYLGDWIWQD